MTMDFQKLKSRVQSRSALAIQLRSHDTTVTLVQSEDGVPRAAQSVFVAISADSAASSPREAGEKLAARLNEEGIREKRCVVCAPPGWALSATTDLPALGEEDLQSYLELRAEQEFPMPVAESRLAHCCYTTADGTHRATIAAVAAKRIAAVEQMLTFAGLRVVSLSLGLSRYSTGAPTGGSLHFLANGTHIDLVIAAGGGIAALRSLAGSITLDEDRFDVPGFCREVRITLGSLPEGVRQQVREVYFEGPVLAANLLRQRTGEQLQRMGLDAALHDAVPGERDVAFSAASAWIQREVVPFEFLPAQKQRWKKFVSRFDSGRQRRMIGAAVALLCLPLVALFIHFHIEDSLEKEWDGMKYTVTDLEGIQQNVRLYRPWFSPQPENLLVLEGVIAAFPEKGDVWAKNIEIADAAKVTCTGFARSHAALLGFLDRLKARPEISTIQVQQERGDNPIQFTMTFKWAASHGI